MCDHAARHEKMMRPRCRLPGCLESVQEILPDQVLGVEEKPAAEAFRRATTASERCLSAGCGMPSEGHDGSNIWPGRLTDGANNRTCIFSDGCRERAVVVSSGSQG
jgi:hypothetical protein